MPHAKFTDLIGLTLTDVKVQREDCNQADEILFKAGRGHFRMFHYQDCCERVTINDICGDLNDLVGTLIVSAEATTNSGRNEEMGDAFTWTFYHIRTNKGTVTIRWYGSSNGYYSQSVDFEELDPTDEWWDEPEFVRPGEEE